MTKYKKFQLPVERILYGDATCPVCRRHYRGTTDHVNVQAVNDMGCCIPCANVCPRKAIGSLVDAITKALTTRT